MIRTLPAMLAIALSIASSRAVANPEPVPIPAEIAREFRVELDSETGAVTLLHAWWGDPMIFGHEGCASGPVPNDRLIDRARDFFWSHADLFHLRRDVHDLTLSAAYECLGSFYVFFDGRYQGVRVFDGGAGVRFDPDERIEAVRMGRMPEIDFDPRQRISREEAERIAAGAVPGGIRSRTVLEEPLLQPRAEGFAPEPRSESRADAKHPEILLVWPATVGTDTKKTWRVLLNARTGAVLSRYVPIRAGR